MNRRQYISETIVASVGASVRDNLKPQRNPAEQTVTMQQERDGGVRWSAWLGQQRMRTKSEKKKDLIEQLAHFLVDNQAGKSIALQMEGSRPPGDPRPGMAREWANLRSASTLQGYPEYD